MSVKTITDYVFTFSKDNEACASVGLNEEVEFKTLDCFCNQVDSEDELITEIDFSKANPSTGPVYVEGVEVGDTLVVEILSIDVADQGVMATIPDLGPLGDQAEIRTKVIPINGDKAMFNDLEIPLNKMIGVIGTAPKEGEVPCGMWGDHGGNMDNKMIAENTTLYLPVHHDGALFQLGDLHAAMGDGELSGTGVEVSGCVKVRFGVIKGRAIQRPIHKTEDTWFTIACRETYDEAMLLAVKDMQELISKAYGWDLTDAYMYLSAQGNVEIAQGVKPSGGGDMVVRMGVPAQKDKPLL